MIEQMNIMNMMIEAMITDEKFLSNIAKLLRRLFNELVEAGFDREEAIQIVSNFKVSG